VPLKDKNNVPPKGWLFRQEQMGWELEEHYRQNDFNMAVRRIQQVRKANPRFDLPTDLGTIAVELENYTVARLQSMPGGDQWITPGGAPPLPFQRRLRTEGGADGVVGAADSGFLKNAVVGIKTWLDFFGSAGPVEKTLAEKRAEVCVKCPHNQQPSGLNVLSSEAAKELSALLSVLKGKKMTTSQDRSLLMCDICGCPNTSKVWVPIDVVLKNLRPATLEKFPPHCWIVGEK
jgi:hypothetical protein